MKETGYPALYQAADAASKRAQASHLLTIRCLAGASIVGALLSLYGLESQPAAVAAAVVLLVGLGLSILMAFRNTEATWYRARAVAESVKTMSWRFMMGVEPFEIGDSHNAVLTFVQRLRIVLAEHKDLAHDLAEEASDADQITAIMRNVRGCTLEERIAMYKDQRIDEQRAWYNSKSRSNKVSGTKWFWILVVLQCGAIFCTLLRIANPSWKFLPTEVFVVAATSSLGWIQFKRYRELAAAYALAAHEIGLAKEELNRVNEEGEFSRFVSETENAFSREHTQWVARKDVA